jgi:hypothetical protein
LQKYEKNAEPPNDSAFILSANDFGKQCQMKRSVLKPMSLKPPNKEFEASKLHKIFPQLLNP